MADLDLRKLNLIFTAIADPNEGTRHNAADAFRTILANAGTNICDLNIAPGRGTAATPGMKLFQDLYNDAAAMNGVLNDKIIKMHGDMADLRTAARTEAAKRVREQAEAQAEIARLHGLLTRVAPGSAAPQPKPQPTAPAGDKGKKWGEVYLPEGTELKVRYLGADYFAVIGKFQVQYQGKEYWTVPQWLTQVKMVHATPARNTGNAWAQVWVRFPGETNFVRAASLR